MSTPPTVRRLTRATHAPRGFQIATRTHEARAGESRDALRIAGIAWAQVRELGFTDRSLVYRLADLNDAVRCLVADLQPDIIVTHAFEGGHPDHDALSLVTRSVARRCLDHGRRVAILEFAGYAQGTDGTLVTNRFVGPPDAPAHRLPVRAGDRRRKRLMFQSFRTQQRTLAMFDTSEEWLRAAPVYDYSAPPNAGQVWYDRFNWEITSTEWIRLAREFLDRTSRRAAVA